nr:hypothetical protein [uncultured bacterium]
MPPTATWAEATSTALHLPQWALSFYGRHVLAISALAIVPTIQRGVYVVAGQSLPDLVNAVLDLITFLCRMALFALIIKFMYDEDRRLGAGGWRGAWSKITAYAHDHWQVLVIHLVLFSVVFGLLNLVMNAAIGAFGGNQAGDSGNVAADLTTFTVRNALIIPFATVWLCGIVRQMIVSE